MEEGNLKLLYDRKGAAFALSISRRSVDYYIAAGELGTRRVGRRVMIPHSELRRFASRDHFGPICRKKQKEGQSNAAKPEAQVDGVNSFTDKSAGSDRLPAKGGHHDHA